MKETAVAAPLFPDHKLSVEDVSDLLGVDSAAVYRAIYRGELPAVKICGRLRIARADVDALVKVVVPKTTTRVVRAS
jgi:excisionase family DNA binding protein